MTTLVSNSTPLDLDYIQFYGYLSKLRAPEYLSLLGWMDKNPEDARQVFGRLHSGKSAGTGQYHIRSVPKGDPSDWSDDKRADANENALVALRAMEADGRTVPTDIERAAMLGYSGWGGLDFKHIFKVDLNLYGEEYRTEFTELKRKLDRGIVPRSNLLARLRDQHFTPQKVCNGMAKLASRVAPISFRRALEPSAGTGRMLAALTATGGPDLDWTLIEYDMQTAELLDAIYSDHYVRKGIPFEEFVREAMPKAGQRFDLILSNPPYMDRQNDVEIIDGTGGYKREEAYFSHRSLDLLAPGGVLVTITPASQLDGSTHKDVRREMLKRAQLAGAMYVSGDLFAGGVSIPLVIHAWIRLAEDRDERSFDATDTAILEGRFREMLGTDNVTMGRWVPGKFGETVKGEWSEESLLGMPLRTLTSDQMTQIRETRATMAPPPSSRIRAASASDRLAQPTQAIASGTGTVFDQAKALSDRVAMFMQVRRTQPIMAEHGRKELLADVKVFMLTYTNPHNIPGIQVYAAEIAPLLAVIRKNNELLPLLTEPVVSETEMELPQEGLSVPGSVAWFCLRKGYADFSDLVQAGFLEDEIEDAIAENKELYIDLTADGTAGSREALRVYTKDAYKSGVITERMDRVDVDRKILSGSPELMFRDRDALLVRLAEQLAFLLEIYAPKTYMDIGATPRSPYVLQHGTENPASMVEEFVNEQLKALDKAWRGHIAVTLDAGGFNFEETTTFKSDPTSKEEPQFAWLAHCIGYMLRQTQVIHPWEKSGTLKNAYKTGDFNERLEEDNRLENEFSGYLAGHPDQVQVVEANYAKSLNSLKGREYDTSPLPLLRLAPNMSLRGFQNATIRRYHALGGLVCAFDVGLGKTSTALGAIALERQSGRARRPIVTMPNAVIVNWYKEARRFFPSFRVGLIGFTSKNGGKTFQEESREERRVKWQRYIAGDFDLLLCPYSTFLSDTAVSLDTAAEVIGRTAYAQNVMTDEVRKLVKALRVVKYKSEEIATLKKEVTRIEEWASKYGVDLAAPGKTAKEYTSAQEKLAAAHEAVKKATVELKGNVTEADLLDMRKTALLKASEKIKELLEDQPWRPSRVTSRSWKDSDPIPALHLHLMRIANAGDDLGEAGVRNVRNWVTAKLVGVEDEGEREAYVEVLNTLDRALQAEVKGKGKASMVIPPGFTYDAPVTTGKNKGQTVERYRLTKNEVVAILNVVDPYIQDVEKGVVPPMVTWEDLGCDMLVVDEAHNFKNLWGIKGKLGEPKIQFMGSHGAEPNNRSYDMYLKTQALLAAQGDRGVLLLTGTPAKNSPLEVYNLLSYISTNLWARLGINGPEQWVDRFMDISADIGLSSTAMVPRQEPTIQRFNPDALPELETAFVYLDYKQPQDVPELKVSIPNFTKVMEMLQLDAGQAPVSERIIGILRHLAGLEKNAHGESKGKCLLRRSAEEGEFFFEPIDPKDPAAKKERAVYMLLCLDYLLKTCLDLRLMRDAYDKILEDLGKEDEVRRKYEAWVVSGRRGKSPKKPMSSNRMSTTDIALTIMDYLEVHKLAEYHNTHTPPKYKALAERIKRNPSCGHLVFCSYAKLIPYVKRALEESGVDPDRIGVLSAEGLDGADREQIAERYNGNDAEELIGVEARDPDFDVLIGTSVMEEGMNLQRRTCALHHLSMPWEPATLKQRNGRAIRQGNKLGHVDVVYYLIERSVDVFRLNQIDGKAGWLDSLFLAGKTELNSPMAEEGMDRAQMVIELICRNEEEREEAMSMYESLKAEKHTKDVADKIQRYVVKGCAVQFAQARQAQDPVRRTALFAQAEINAQRALSMPDSDFPTKFLVDMARTRNIYVNPKAPTQWAAEGKNMLWVPQVEWKPGTYENGYKGRTEFEWSPVEVISASPAFPHITIRSQGSLKASHYVSIDQVYQTLVSSRPPTPDDIESYLKSKQEQTAGVLPPGYSLDQVAKVRHGVLWGENAGPAFNDTLDREQVANSIGSIDSYFHVKDTMAATLRNDASLLRTVQNRIINEAGYNWVTRLALPSLNVTATLPWMKDDQLASSAVPTLVAVADSAGRVYCFSVAFLRDLLNDSGYQRITGFPDLDVEGTRPDTEAKLKRFLLSHRIPGLGDVDRRTVDGALYRFEVFYIGGQRSMVRRPEGGHTYQYDLNITRVNPLESVKLYSSTVGAPVLVSVPEVFIAALVTPYVNVHRTFFQKLGAAYRRKLAAEKGIELPKGGSAAEGSRAQGKPVGFGDTRFNLKG